MSGLILTVGNPLLGDDSAGPELTRLLEEAPLPGWEVLDGEAVPENCLHIIRRMKPERVIIFDATMMGLEPGTLRQLTEADIARPTFMNTHCITLTYLMLALKEFVNQVSFIGIEPQEVTFGRQITPKVNAGVKRFYQLLKEGRVDQIPQLSGQGRCTMI